MEQGAKEKFSLKDALFNKQKIEKIADEIKHVFPEFNGSNFIKIVLKRFPELELKQRISLIRECLKEYLPTDYKTAVNILLKSMPESLDNTNTDDDFGDFIYAPYTEYVATYGCNKKDFMFSMAALKEMTTRFSAEDAIRYFINEFPEETLKQLQKWTLDKHYHVRRLASEGTRPKLPWAKKISIPVENAIPILDNLFKDKARYVTRSVANHLNDISKTNPALVLSILKKWKNSGKQNSIEMDYIIKHSLRTLLKKGNKEAMKFLNFSPKTKVTLTAFAIENRKIKIGESLEFSCTIKSKADEKVLIDYTIYFWSKAGHNNNKKVFKLKQTEILKNQPLIIIKRHRFIAEMTTRKIYPGKHFIEIQVNGNKMGKEEFELVLR